MNGAFFRRGSGKSGKALSPANPGSLAGAGAGVRNPVRNLDFHLLCRDDPRLSTFFERVAGVPKVPVRCFLNQ
jgi:hypothetical protein